MKHFLGSCALAAFAASAACGTGTGTGGPSGPVGGEGSGGAGGAQLSGAITIENLNVTVDKVEGEVRLTFSVKNGTGKAISECNGGSLAASTGESAPVDPDQYGSCLGFEPQGGGVASFCADSSLSSLCEYGLSSGQQTDVLAVHGESAGGGWEATGTEYQLTLSLLMDDAELVEIGASAVIGE